jgi:signal transduction histidine kinase
MEIRRKLLYQFIATVALILFLSSLAIYVSFSKIRKDEFYERLDSKAKMVAQMLIDIEEIDAELLKKIEKNNPVSLPNEKIIIYDYQNNVLFSTDEDHILKITTELLDAIRLNETLRLKQKPYEILGQFYASRYERYVVLAAAIDIFGLNKLYRLRVILIIVFLFSLVIVFFSGRIYSSRALKPISDTMSQVDAIGVSNLNLRVSEGNGTDELALLAKTFNKMLDRIEIAFKTQKNFIANASHELRTPLTVITGQLEVILMNPRNNKEYKNTIISALEEIKNLNNISNRLLLLAQTSSDFSETDQKLIRIDDILWQTRKEILKRFKDYQIHINLSETIDDESKLTIKGNELFIKTALNNLIDNGCKYSNDHTIEIFINSNNNNVIIDFLDKGMGIPNDEINMIFQPFYRAKNAMDIKGHGIGLSLVDKIIALHKGNIQVKSEIMKGTNFTVSIPLSL